MADARWKGILDAPKIIILVWGVEAVVGSSTRGA